MYKPQKTILDDYFEETINFRCNDISLKDILDLIPQGVDPKMVEIRFRKENSYSDEIDTMVLEWRTYKPNPKYEKELAEYKAYLEKELKDIE